ncbi:DUF2513 domain-containing protein [Ralstonia sp. 22111]|uniref:DUF2513 domain-containing protein n=1 Tax=Ralstonia sp. 22111 TaxID=3453878 RepID=UPI003F87C595
MTDTMKRDWELVRTVLTDLEAQDPNSGDGLTTEGFEGFSAAVVAYHFRLLDEAGLIVSRELRTGVFSPGSHTAIRLTWDGHEFLDKIRNDQFWNKVKKTLAEKGVSLGFDAIKTAATYLIKTQFPS